MVWRTARTQKSTKIVIFLLIFVQHSIPCALNLEASRSFWGNSMHLFFKMVCTSKKVDRGAKQPENLHSWSLVLVAHIWGTLDPVLFNIFWRSFSASLSERPATRKWLIVERNLLTYGTLDVSNTYKYRVACRVRCDFGLSSAVVICMMEQLYNDVNFHTNCCRSAEHEGPWTSCCIP